MNRIVILVIVVFTTFGCGVEPDPIFTSNNEFEVNTDIDTGDDTDNDTETDTDNDTETDTGDDTDNDTETDTDNDTETDTDDDTETDTDDDTDTETEDDTETDTDNDTETEDETICKPGETQKCFCIDSGTNEGVQVCSEDGMEWEECSCKAPCPWGSGYPCPCIRFDSNGESLKCNDGSTCVGMVDSNPSEGICTPECLDPSGNSIYDCDNTEYNGKGKCELGHSCFLTCGDDSQCPPGTICFDAISLDIGYPWNFCHPI